MVRSGGSASVSHAAQPADHRFFEHGAGRLLLLVGRVAVLPQDTLERPAQVGTDKLTKLPSRP